MRSQRGLIRYCPICDGYEVTDKKVGVLGSGHHGVAEAVFLRGYTADVTLIAPDKAIEGLGCRPAGAGGRGHRDRRRAGGSSGDRGRTALRSIPQKAISPSTASIRRWAATCIASWPKWSARGSTTTAASASTRIMRTSVDGVYAAGDLVIGLDQISNAMGQGGVAATTIRNDLAKEKPILREQPKGEFKPMKLEWLR